MKTTLLNFAIAFTVLWGALLFHLPQANGQQAIDFREAIRTAEPALFTITVDATQHDRVAKDQNDLDHSDKPDASSIAPEDGTDTSPDGKENQNDSPGPQIEFFDLSGQPLQPGQAVQPRQRMKMGRQEMRRRFANPRAESLKSAAFAIDDSVLIGYIGREVDSVSVVDGAGNQMQGQVKTYDHVTGLAAISTSEPVNARLIISAAKTEPGQAVVAAWRDNHLHADAGMISSHMISNDAGIGLASAIDFGGSDQLVGSPVLDATGILVGALVPGKTGRLALVDAGIIGRLAQNASSGTPGNLKRGLVGIQFEGGGPLVLQVSPNSGAASAGIQAGDLVIQVGDYQVNDALDVVSSVASARAGDTIDLVVRRDQEQLTIPVTLSEHPQQHPEHRLSQNAVFPMQNGFELKDGKLIPLQPGQDLPPQMFNFGKIPVDEIFPPIEFPGGANSPMWRIPLNGRINGMHVERSDMEETLKDLKRQLEQLNQKFDEQN